MFYVLFTYNEPGFGPMYTFTCHTSQYVANEAVIGWLNEKPQATYKIFKGEIIQEGP